MRFNTKEKILYIHHHLQSAGGIQRIITEKANYFAAEGLEVTVLSLGAVSRDFFPLSAQIRRVFMELPPNIPQGEYRKKLEVFLTSNSFDVVVSVMYSPEMYFLPKIKDGSKKILEYHTSFAFSKGFTSLKYQPLVALKERLAFLKFKNAAAQFDHFVVLTEEDAADWRKHLKNVVVIPNFTAETPPARCIPKRNKIIAVGRLEGVKQFGKLIDAWNLIRDEMKGYRLEIFGEGPLKEDLQKKINGYQLNHQVILMGSEKDIAKIYGDAQFLVSTSSYEGLPMVFLEAMNFGLPIISFDFKTGPKDLIDDGKTGFIVPKNDLATLAEKIHLLAGNEKMRILFANNSKVFLQKFHKAEILKKWQTVFSQ